MVNKPDNKKAIKKAVIEAKKFIDAIDSDSYEEFETAFGYAVGTITLVSGNKKKKCQIQVKIEADEDEWI